MRRCFTKDSICDSTLSSILAVVELAEEALGYETHFTVPPYAGWCDRWILTSPTQTFSLICIMAAHRCSSKAQVVHTQIFPRSCPAGAGTGWMHVWKLFFSPHHVPSLPSLPTFLRWKCPHSLSLAPKAELLILPEMKLLLWTSMDRDYHSNRSYVWKPWELFLLPHPFRLLFRLLSFIYLFILKCFHSWGCAPSEVLWEQPIRLQQCATSDQLQATFVDHCIGKRYPAGSKEDLNEVNWKRIDSGRVASCM